MSALLVAVGGAAGAVLRWWLARLSTEAWPWGTFVANMIGCAVLGLVVGWPVVDGPGPVRAGLAVGLLGGLTTFSTFAVEVVRPRRSRWAYLAATAAGGLLAAIAGGAAGRLLG